jgi:biotin carboxyl carrier protein
VALSQGPPHRATPEIVVIPDRDVRPNGGPASVEERPSWWNAPAGLWCTTRGERVTEQICAEMVANVFSVTVTEGDRVEAGATLLVLESMKMEIPVLCETGGMVTEVKVQPGDVVQEGDVLVVVT